MIRVILQEEKNIIEKVNGMDLESDKKHLVKTHEVLSEDKTVVANFLRGLANVLDPPKNVTR